MLDFFEISDLIVDNNNQYIIANKPAGLPCVPDKSEDKNLKNLLESYAKHDIHVITRIDRPVSGLTIFGKSQKAARSLTTQIQEKKIEKTYLAIVEGTPKDSSATITDYLLKSNGNKSIVASVEDKKAKEAILSFDTVLKLENYTILKVKIKTGRFHQIRVQLSNYGCPIKGDVKYGARRKNKDRSIYLHAYQVNFQHPVTIEKQNYTTLPDQSDNLWKLLPKDF